MKVLQRSVELGIPALERVAVGGQVRDPLLRRENRRGELCVGSRRQVVLAEEARRWRLDRSSSRTFATVSSQPLVLVGEVPVGNRPIGRSGGPKRAGASVGTDLGDGVGDVCLRNELTFQDQPVVAAADVAK